MDKLTNGRAKNYMPPIYRCGGIKIQNEETQALSTRVYNNGEDNRQKRTAKKYTASETQNNARTNRLT